MMILVVDDNVDLAESVADVLRADGHHVLVAYDGASALHLAQVAAPDAVVLDLRLPDQTGYDVARMLRQGALEREAVILLLTADPEPAFDTASAVGVDLVLRKPMLVAELTRMIAFVRGRKRHLRYATA